MYGQGGGNLSKLTFAIIIPARLASNRLPRKVLLKKTGKYLVQHVWEQLASLNKSGRIIIATDSKEVLMAAESFGAEAQLTRPDHPSGTDRVAEVAADIDASVIINVQGDEPTTSPEDIIRLLEPFKTDPKLQMATLARKRTDNSVQLNPNIVKVVTDNNSNALYFSRAPIPFSREGSKTTWLHHVGIYAYRKELLLHLSDLAPTTLEEVEKLEQLRVLGHGYKIKIVLTDKSYEGIDTQEQYDTFVNSFLKIKGGN